MLELRTYTKAELVEMFHTNSREGIVRRLNNYGITFTCEGNGNNLKVTINSIPDPFKVFCILDLGFRPQCDFVKMREFFWAYFQDDEFRSLPDEVLEYRLREDGPGVSRQTIARWKERLSTLGLIWISTNEFLYYFAYQHTQRMTDKAEYCQAWHEYWEARGKGAKSREAIGYMIVDYGGVARKQPCVDLNGIYAGTITALLEYIQESIENELNN